MWVNIFISYSRFICYRTSLSLVLFILTFWHYHLFISYSRLIFKIDFHCIHFLLFSFSFSLVYFILPGLSNTIIFCIVPIPPSYSIIYRNLPLSTLPQNEFTYWFIIQDPFSRFIFYCIIFNCTSLNLYLTMTFQHYYLRSTSINPYTLFIKIN